MNRKRLYSLSIALLLCALAVWFLAAGRGDSAPSRSRSAPRTAESAGPPRPPESVPAPSPPPAGALWRLVDLLDGNGAGHLQVRLEPAGVDAESDAAGLVRVPPDRARAADRVEVVTEGWHVAGVDPRSLEAGASPAVVRVYRDLQLEGQLVADTGDALDFSVVPLSFEVTGDPDLGDAERLRGLAALWSLGIRTRGSLGSPSGTGAFSGAVPRLRGIRVVAGTPDGWSGTSDPILPSSTDERCHVAVTVSNGMEVSGRLLDEDGNGLADVSVVLCVSIRGDPATLDFEEARRLAGGAGVVCGLGFRSDPGGGRSIATFFYSARTDREGRYRVMVRQRGELLVQAYPPGRGIATRRERVDGARTSFDLRSEPARPDSVRILVEGEPATNRKIEITEVNRGMPQICYPALQADEEGVIRTTYLVAGNAYIISAGGGDQEFVEWSGQQSVDITPLSKKNGELLPDGWW